jgi:hypothetical protein
MRYLLRFTTIKIILTCISLCPLKIIQKDKELLGRGTLTVNNTEYQVVLRYSPFLDYRFDRIYILNQSIEYNNKIHVYRDLSLCLYHPVIDKPYNKIIPLVKMIPWISEWCIHYEEWKKYKVWMGKEILH